MNKRGIIEHQVFFAMEAVLGILVAGILISNAANFDSLSNINKIYAQEDLKLLSETLLASPGSVEYAYPIKSLYDVDIADKQITVSKTDSLLAGYSYYNLTFSKEQGSQELQVEKNA